MSLPSKEEQIVSLFYNQSSKHWHFEDIIKTSKVSRSKANKWLTKLIHQEIIMHVKPEGKMPYFKASFESLSYRTSKKLFALAQMQKTGFLNHLLSLKEAKTVIIFGSFSRADWHAESDIDLFIYGNDDDLDIRTYSTLLNREIQLFTARNPADLEKFGSGLLRNILEGVLVKGKIEFVEVTPIATV